MAEFHWARIPFKVAEYSDWQLDIQFGESDRQASDDNSDNSESEDASYMVHRCMLKPRSEYFKSIFFQSSALSGLSERRSVIEFPSDAPFSFHNFEQLLDYFYSNPQTIETEEWKSSDGIALLYLADYFGAPKLHQAALEFCEQIVELEGGEVIARLYEVAERLSIETLLDQIASKCHCDTGCYFQTIWDSIQTPEMKSKLLHHIYTIRKDSVDSYKMRWHEKITYAMKSDPEVIDEDFFLELIEEGEREVMMGEEAIGYLKHERWLGLDKPESEKLTQVQRLCMDHLYDLRHGYWEVRDAFTPKDLLSGLRQLKPAILDTLLLSAMERNSYDGSH